MDNQEYLENYLTTNGITYSVLPNHYLINEQYIFNKDFVGMADQEWLLKELEAVKNKIENV